MAEAVTIPVSFFEITNEYEWPDLQPWVERANIVQAVLNALRSWGPHLDDVEPLTSGKLSEQGFLIRLPLKRITLFFGAASSRYSRDAIDWSMADETISIFDAAWTAFTKLSNVVTARRQSAVGLHIQPKTIPFVQLLQPFVPAQICALDVAPLRTIAFVAKWDHRRITLDGSGSLANAIFLKFEREFPGSVAYGEIAEQLWKDEVELLGILGVKEEQ